MPGIDIRPLKWERWFEQDPPPSWPAELTKKHWDKKKSLTAKATSTGIGAQLDVVKKAFDKAVEKRIVFAPRNLDEVETRKVEATNFAKSSEIKKLHDGLKELRDLAKDAKAKYQKSKAPGLKSTIELCGTYETAADQLMVCCNGNSMRGYLTTVVQERTDKINEAARKKAQPTLDQMRGVPAKVLKGLEKLERLLDALVERDPEETDTEAWKKLRSDIGTPLHTLARDMTQPIVNMHKAIQAGISFDGVTPQTIEKLKKHLVPYGNDGEASCTSASPDEIRQKIAAVRKGATKFAEFSETAQITLA